EVMHAHLLDLEQDLPTVGEPACDQVLDHLLLAVDGNAAADERLEIDLVQHAVHAELDTVVEHGLALEPLADAGPDQEIGRPMLDQAGADAAFDIVAAAVFEDDALDPVEMQEMRQHQPRRPRADDADLGAHRQPSAAARSAIRSSGSSMPTDSRTSVSPM